MNYTPLSNKVLVKVKPQSEVTAGGIYKVAGTDEILHATVVATGRGTPMVNESGEWSIIPLECKKGDTVMFPVGVGQDIEVDNEKFLLIVEDMIFMREPAQ